MHGGLRPIREASCRRGAHVDMYVCVYIYIYMYRERERYRYTYIYIYIYYVYVSWPFVAKSHGSKRPWFEAPESHDGTLRPIHITFGPRP